MNNTSNKRKLLNRLRALDFSLIEIGLFLDTHPNNAKALAYFNKLNAEREKVNNEYTEKFGPLVMTDSKSADSWDWVKSAWPWEMED